jgi:hypothetical protein
MGVKRLRFEPVGRVITTLRAGRADRGGVAFGRARAQRLRGGYKPAGGPSAKPENSEAGGLLRKVHRI